MRLAANLLRGIAALVLIRRAMRPGALVGPGKSRAALRVEAVGWWVGGEPHLARTLWKAAR